MHKVSFHSLLIILGRKKNLDFKFIIFSFIHCAFTVILRNLASLMLHFFFLLSWLFFMQLRVLCLHLVPWSNFRFVVQQQDHQYGIACTAAECNTGIPYGHLFIPRLLYPVSYWWPGKGRGGGLGACVPVIRVGDLHEVSGCWLWLDSAWPLQQLGK